MQETLIASALGFIGSIVVTLILTLYFSRKLQPFEKMGDIISNIAGDDQSVTNISNAANSLVQIGVLAQTGNEIFQDEALFDGILNTIAQRAVKIFQMSILGTKSGDSRRLQKAETLVNEGLVEGIKSLNPLIGVALKATGLDEELRKDPEMFQYIMQVIMDKGLLNFLDPSMLGMGGNVQGQETMNESQGVRF